MCELNHGEGAEMRELSLDAAELALRVDKDGTHFLGIANYTRIIIQKVASYYGGGESGETAKRRT